MAFPIDSSSNVISVLGASKYNNGAIQTANFMFPIMSLVTSIPVFMIIIRLNLVQAKLVSQCKNMKILVLHF